MTASEYQTFHVAAFDAAGEFVGQTMFDGARLSPKWSQFCDALLTANGELFAVNLTGPLAHISLRFTSTSGAAIATISAGGRLANSLLLLSGREPEADREVRDMFHQAVATTATKLGRPRNPLPFCDLSRLENRPLACVVAWGSSQVSEEDDSLIKELSWHLAGAFFKR
jgi:hypothetical protein